MIKQPQRVIRASIGAKVLTHSAELFDQHLSTIANELLQNSRRAGATLVEITISALGDYTEITVSDNGCGIDDPAVVLQFGGSGWSEDCERTETPAGMGVYSLARRGCVLRSRDWIAEIDHDAFIGKKDVVLADAEPITGTSVTFSVDTKAYPTHYAETIFTHAARYYPAAVTINGQAVRQESFLAGAVHIKEVDGVRIGVFRDLSHDTETVNFYGLAIKHRGFPEIRYALSMPMENRSTFRTLGVRVDIIDAPELRFVLPTRDKLQESHALTRLNAQCDLAMLEYAAATPHALSFADYQRARDLGLQPPLPALRFERFVPHGEETNIEWEYIGTNTEVPADPAVTIRAGVFADVQPAVRASIQRAIEAHAPQIVVAKDIPGFEGYEHYDAFESIDNVSYEATIDGTTYRWSEYDDDREFPEGVEAVYAQRRTYVENPTVVLHLANNARERHIALPTDLLMLPNTDSDYYIPDCTRVMITRDSQISECDLATLIVFSYFYAYDDYEADSWDTQKEEAEDLAQETAASILFSESELAKRRIVDTAHTLATLLCAPFTEVHIDATGVRIIEASGETETSHVFLRKTTATGHD